MEVTLSLWGLPRWMGGQGHARCLALGNGCRGDEGSGCVLGGGACQALQVLWASDLLSVEPETHQGAEQDRAPRASKTVEREGAFWGRQDSFNLGGKRVPAHHPKAGGSTPAAEGPHSLCRQLGVCGQRCPDWGKQGSPGSASQTWKRPAGSAPRAVRGLPQLQMTATRWHRRVQLGQPWPSVLPAAQEDTGAQGSRLGRSLPLAHCTPSSGEVRPTRRTTFVCSGGI